MLREVRESTDMLAEDVGQVKDTAAIWKTSRMYTFCGRMKPQGEKVQSAQNVKLQMINNERTTVTGHRAPVLGLTCIKKNKMDGISA